MCIAWWIACTTLLHCVLRVIVKTFFLGSLARPGIVNNSNKFVFLFCSCFVEFGKQQLWLLCELVDSNSWQSFQNMLLVWQWIFNLHVSLMYGWKDRFGTFLLDNCCSETFNLSACVDGQMSFSDMLECGLHKVSGRMGACYFPTLGWA